jgi:uncharacterized protein (DUF1330 family)
MRALFIIQAQLSDDPSFMLRYKQYQTQLQPVMKSFGGKVLAIGQHLEVMEGDHDGRRLIVLEFPSMTHLKDFWHSPAYAQIKPLREHGAQIQAWAVPTLD